MPTPQVSSSSVAKDLVILHNDFWAILTGGSKICNLLPQIIAILWPNVYVQSSKSRFFFKFKFWFIGHFDFYRRAGASSEPPKLASSLRGTPRTPSVPWFSNFLYGGSKPSPYGIWCCFIVGGHSVHPLKRKPTKDYVHTNITITRHSEQREVSGAKFTKRLTPSTFTCAGIYNRVVVTFRTEVTFKCI